MKFTYRIILLALIAVTAPSAKAAHATSKDSLLIRNVHIVTADAQVSPQPLNLLIEEGHIQTIGTREFSADQVIDGKGQYLIPGLIDTHVHLRDVPGLLEPRDSALYQKAAAQIPRSYLYAGFTSLLDLANTGEFIDQWNSQPLAPQAYFCTPILIPQGYPVVVLPKDTQDAAAITRHYLHDRHSPTAAAIVDADEHTPAKLVDAGKKEGARCVKVFYEKGFGANRNLPVPSDAIVRELVAAAHKQNLPVFLHGNSQESYEFALQTGVDVIAHGLWNADEKTTKADLTQLANRLAKAGIAIQPTVQVIYGEQELFNPEFLLQTDVKHTMPADLISWYQSDAGQWMKREMATHFKNTSALTPEQEYQQVKTVYAPLLERVALVARQLNTQKSPLVFGSDTPSGPMYTQFPGLNGRREMDRWLAMGISLPDLFKAMTIGNAKKMGLEKEIGSIATHKVANLLLLGKNPLVDVTAYDSINWVILRGQAIPRASLSATNSTTNN